MQQQSSLSDHILQWLQQHQLGTEVIIQQKGAAGTSCNPATQHVLLGMSGAAGRPSCDTKEVALRDGSMPQGAEPQALLTFHAAHL